MNPTTLNYLVNFEYQAHNVHVCTKKSNVRFFALTVQRLLQIKSSKNKNAERRFYKTEKCVGPVPR